MSPFALLITVIASLCGIIYQDFKVRAIHWFWLVIVFCSLTFKMTLESSWQIVLQNMSLNLLFLGMQLTLLFIYFSVRNKALTNIVDKDIGLGDVLFFVAICPGFSLLNYIVFLLAGFVVISTGYLILIAAGRTKAPQIPLAGLFSIGLIIALITNQLKIINLTDDSYILSSLHLL